MRRAGALLMLGAALALPAPAAAQARSEPGGQATSPAARPFGGAPGQPRFPQTLREPLALTPRTTTQLRSEPAPVPNRDIEPPRTRVGEALLPSIEPMMLPPERQQGMTFGREHLRETGPDRPFDNLVPGARLRIPFESGGTAGR
jgi:hypothetical protein